LNRFYIFILTVICTFYVFFLTSCDNKRLSLRVKYYSESCFGSEENELTVYDVEDSTIAILKTKGEKTKQTSLNAGQIPALNAFLYEFKQLTKKNCVSTIERNYVVTYLDGYSLKTLSKKVNCFTWDGFDRLRYVLFQY
jgi:hypothetical protein